MDLLPEPVSGPGARQADIAIPMRSSGFSALHDMAYMWLSDELSGQSPIIRRRRYAEDLAFFLAHLGGCWGRGDEHLQINKIWAAAWIAFLDDCRFPATAQVRSDAQALGWSTERPRHWPREPKAFGW